MRTPKDSFPGCFWLLDSLFLFWKLKGGIKKPERFHCFEKKKPPLTEEGTSASRWQRHVHPCGTASSLRANCLRAFLLGLSMTETVFSPVSVFCLCVRNPEVGRIRQARHISNEHRRQAVKTPSKESSLAPRRAFTERNSPAIFSFTQNAPPLA